MLYARGIPMRRASTLRFFTFVLLVLALVPARAAHAQMSETERKAAARAAYMEGVQLQDANKPADALAKFEAAEKLYDAPTHLLHIAQCQAAVGKLVEAQETYEVLIHKSLGASPPEAFVSAQKTGEQELPALRQRIPTLRISVKPDPSQLPNLQVLVNNVQVPNELLGIARPVNPGAYKITAAATGWATPGPTEVELRDKDQRPVELTLLRQATAVTPLPVPPPYTGNPGAAATVTPPPPGATPPPPPTSEAPKPVPTGSSDTGLLLGLHGGLFFPGGTAVPPITGTNGSSAAVPFDNVAGSGGGVGLDGVFRVGRTVLLGLMFDYASLGSPKNASSDYSASTLYYGALLGLLANPDKVSFYGDVSLGYRKLSVSDAGATGKLDSTLGGFELGLDMGVMIPAGPVRILPKVGINYGQFSSIELCRSNTCINGSPDSPGFHTMIFAGLAAYYSLDLGKKK